MNVEELYQKMDEGERQIYDILHDYNQMNDLGEFVKRMMKKYKNKEE